MEESTKDTANAQIFDKPSTATMGNSPRKILSVKFVILGGVSIGLLLLLSMGLGMSIKGFTEMYVLGLQKNPPVANTQRVDKHSLPMMAQDKKNTSETKTASSGNAATGTSQQVSSYQISQMRNYCSLLSSYISGAESARGQVSEEDLNKLLDSYNRQKVFCDTLLSRIGDKNTISKEDDAMWESISKLSYESSALFYKIFGR